MHNGAGYCQEWATKHHLFRVHAKAHDQAVFVGFRPKGNLTNGARGEIVDIILDPDEPPIGDEPIVHLKRIPAYIRVKLRQTRVTQLAGLDKLVIPIEPTKTTYRMKVKFPSGKWRRNQLSGSSSRLQGPTCSPITARKVKHCHLFLWTSQHHLPGAKPLQFLCRIVEEFRTRPIRLLRGFDDEMFQKAHDPSSSTAGRG
ncbi:hypothetical protein DFH09DRAFT_1069499 [Mycena vulgaris]|nr:hypothetical protein DFH09DRAFT_1069499 [Mycena vulgaris]